MDQQNELAAVKRKIRAALAKTTDRGATEAEAMAAMAIIGRLCQQYNLSMDEITLRDEPCVTKKFFTGSKHRNVLWYVYSGFADLLGIKIWFERTPDGLAWNYFGLEPDVDMALYLAELIQTTEVTATRLFKQSSTYKSFRSHRKIASNNFKEGFGARMNQRLVDIARENKEAEKKAAEYHAQQHEEKGTMLTASDAAVAEYARQKTGTALITLAKAKMIEEEFKKESVKLKKCRSYSNSRYDANSRSAGSKAADKVNLGRPVANNASTSGLLE